MDSLFYYLEEIDSLSMAFLIDEFLTGATTLLNSNYMSLNSFSLEVSLSMPPE
jgi:hypothetical protein